MHLDLVPYASLYASKPTPSEHLDHSSSPANVVGRSVSYRSRAARSATREGSPRRTLQEQIHNGSLSAMSNRVRTPHRPMRWRKLGQIMSLCRKKRKLLV